MVDVVFSIVLGIVLSLIVVFGDYLIKLASTQNGFSGWHLLVFGAIIYGLTGVGWFFVMRHLKLSTIGVVFGMSCLIALTLISIFYFNEKINGYEIFGIILAITSIIILARFA